MRHRPLALATLTCIALGANAAHADDAALKAEVEQLRAQVAALTDAVHQLQQARGPAVAATPAPVTPSATPAANAPVVAATAATPAAASAPAPAETTLWGYGELNYNHPTARASDSQADLRRAVVGFSHAFDESTHVYGELEWEHAVTSAEDQGESEVEQLYVEHALAPNYGVRAGLMLVPLGLLNEHHEPTNYYGVERNFVETAIIPSTWREGGIAGYGSTDEGLAWNVGVGTGPDLGKWDATSDEGRASPLGSIHQELQLAKARDPSLWGSLNYNGVPGLNVGGGVFTGKIGQGSTELPIADSRLVLSEVHARWQSGPFDLAGLYTRGTISDVQAYDLSVLGQPTPVPKAFWGGYVQGAWRALEWDRSYLSPFVRYEAFSTAASYPTLPQGLGPVAGPTQRVWTVGANYYLNPNVVFKIDYQDFRYDDSALGYGNRFDIGVGYQF